MSRGCLYAEKPNSLDRSVCGDFDTFGHTGAKPSAARKNLQHPGVGLRPGSPKDFRDRESGGDERSQIHVYDDTSVPDTVKPDQPHSLKRHSEYIGHMDTWPERLAFKSHVAKYARATEKTQKLIADDLGLELSSLRNLLHRSDRKPGIDTLTRASALFGCSITEFIDDPGGTIPGIDQPDLARLSQAKKAVMNMMFQNLRHEEVTDKQALQYLKVIESLVAAGKMRKPDWE